MKSHLETVTVGQRELRERELGGVGHGKARVGTGTCSCNDLNNDLPAAVQEYVQYRYRDSLET